MAPAAAGSCISGVARQFAPGLKAISSLGALTGFTCRFTGRPAVAAAWTNARKVSVRRMDSPKRNNVKLLVAVIGGGVIAMGALSAAVGQEQAGQESVAKSSSMNIGATTTETTPPSGGGDDDGRAGNEGPGPAACRRAVARGAVASQGDCTRARSTRRFTSDRIGYPEQRRGRPSTRQGPNGVVRGEIESAQTCRGGYRCRRTR